MELKELQTFWKTYRSFHNYQHLAILMGASTSEANKMLYWDDILDSIAHKERQQWMKERREHKLKLHEWKEELGSFAHEARVRYLESRAEPLLNDINEYEKKLAILQKKHAPILEQLWLSIEYGVSTKIALLKKINVELDRERNWQQVTQKEITDDMIARAKEYPIETLIEFGRSGFAHCPYHNEKTPSFSWNKRLNRAHCFGCGKDVDTIQYVMDTMNKNFVDAVKYLNNNIT